VKGVVLKSGPTVSSRLSLFPYCLFNDAVSNSDYIASNGRMIGK
jgi:hypothetical protein